MKKDLFVAIAMISFVLAAGYFWNRHRDPVLPESESLEVFSEQGSPRSSGTPQAPSSRSTPDRQMASIPEAVRAYKNFFADKVPAKWASQTQGRLEKSNAEVWKLDLLVNGIPVEGSDARIVQESGRWVLYGGILPPLPEQLSSFPDSLSDENLEHIVRSSLPGRNGTIRASGKSWIPQEGALVPCVRYNVDYPDESARLTRRENWCVNPATREVLFKNARGKF